ncbi:tyrosinase family oxidase copper chaperone [Streptomyces sp. NPDC088762]|uniref:apotyrosinase chaperone MelC1 n=1 Tax=Streptomyces sp. NPDC088762 TaxID=3365891 RepID=UPI00381BC151
MKKITRRQVFGITSGAALALGLTSCSSSPSSSPASATGPAAGAPASPVSIPTGGIDEVYEGRRIQITLGAGGHHGVGMPKITIDGNELHLMANADGSWVTVVNHYETFKDPVSAARAAVRDLQGAALVPFVAKEVKL